MPDQVHAVEPQRVQEPGHVGPHEFERVRARPVASAVTAQVEGVHPPVAGEGGRHRGPVGGALAERVQQDERRGVRGPGHPVGQPDAAHVDRVMINHARSVGGGGVPRNAVHRRLHAARCTLHPEPRSAWLLPYRDLSANAARPESRPSARQFTSQPWRGPRDTSRKAAVRPWRTSRKAAVSRLLPTPPTISRHLQNCRPQAAPWVSHRVIRP